MTTLARVLAAMTAGFVAAACPAPRPAGPAAAAPGRVVVISVDGLMPETYLDADRLGLRIPTLRRLVAGGAFARAVVPVFPTVTYPAHTTMVTGVAPAAHGIVTNRPPDPLDKNLGGWRWYAEDIAVPTLWEAVEAQGRASALITWPVTVGARVHTLVPEYWRAGTADDQKLLRALTTPGLLDRVAAREPGLWGWLAPPDIADDAQLAIAREVLAADGGPDLVLVHVWMVDDAQHRHGPRSREAYAAIEHVDELLGGLVAELEASPAWPRTTVVVVSDHGFAPVTQQIRLAPLFADRGLVELGADGKPTRARVTLVASGGTAFLYADDTAALAELGTAIASVGAPIARVYRREDIAAAGGDPAASLVVAAAPGYQFSDKRERPLVVPSTGKGDHGYPPNDPAMAASFVAYGPRIPARDLGTIDMLEIAPTLASWLGVALPAATRPPIAGLVADQPRSTR